MKSKSTIVIAALVLIVAAAFLIARQSASSDAYETFTMAMDHVVGQGNWTAKGHEISSAGGSLTVNGVNIRLTGKKASQPAPASSEPAPAGEESKENATPAAVDPTVEIASIEIKKGLSKAALENIIKAQNWRDQKETKIADGITLKGVSFKLPMTGMEPSLMAVEAVDMKSVALAAAGSNAPEGAAGFLKALRMDNFSYTKFKVTSRNQDVAVDMLLDEMSAQGVNFGEEAFPGLEAMDPSGFSTVMSSMAVKSAAMKNMTMNFKDQNEDFQALVTIAGIDEQDIRSFNHIGHASLTGLNFSVKSKKGVPIEFKMDKAAVNGFDMSEYMKKMMPVMIAATMDPESADDLMSDLQTLGDVFVSPFSLNDFSMSGMDLKIGGVQFFKLAECSVVGPYKAGQIPATQKSSLKGFELFLPTEPKFAGEDAKEIYEFGRNFGMTHFVMDAEGEGLHDPSTGNITSRITKFSVKDLVDISGHIEFGGLTPERVDTLKSIPLKTAFVALMNPEAVFGQMSLKSFNLKVVDHSLTNRVMKMMAVESLGEKASADDFRAMAVITVKQQLGMQSAMFLENSSVLVNSLVAFLEKPGSLELNLAADPALSFKSVMEMNNDTNKILNSLNISLSANEEKAPALKFTLPRM